MGKKSAPRPVAENEARAIARVLRTSPRKLNLLAKQIRGMGVQTALNELSFSNRRVAADVKKVLQSAVANAENNHQLDVDRLYVAEATVGRAFSMWRFHARARGRVSYVQKYWSNLTVVVREREETA